LGNLVDNAVRAAVAGAEPRHVRIGCFGDAADLVLTVADSGAGVPSGIDPFARADRRPRNEDRIHGWGVGLPLSRELARRRGGDVWLIDAGGAPRGSGAGAVFAARLVGVLDAGPRESPIHPESPVSPAKDTTP